MKITNKTKHTVIAAHAVFLKGVFEKAEGLLNAEAPEAVMFRTRWGIHTVGMKFPIDVIITDRKHTVKKVKHAMPSGKFLFWNPRYERVIELPHGAIRSSQTDIGDTLEIA